MIEPGGSGILDTHLLPAFGATKIADIDAETIEEFTATLADRTPTTIRNIHRVLHPILRRAVRSGYLSTNPLLEVEGRPKVTPRDPSKLAFLTMEQVLQLAEEVGPRYRTLIRIAVFTGARWGELAALQVRDFDPLHGKLAVRKSATYIGDTLYIDKPKNGKGRPYTLDDEMTAMLSAEIEGRRPDSFIFGSSTS